MDRQAYPNSYEGSERKRLLRSMNELARMADEHDSTDVLGSYTGMAQDGMPPTQDVDDL